MTFRPLRLVSLAGGLHGGWDGKGPTLGKYLAGHASKLVGERVQQVLQLGGQLSAGILGRLCTDRGLVWPLRGLAVRLSGALTLVVWLALESFCEAMAAAR